MRKTPILLALVLAASAAGLSATHAAAQDYQDNGYDDGYYDDSDYADRGPPRNPPPAGADVAYDYLTGEYYRYEGPAPQAPAAREQRGYRDGTVEREPTTSYYSGVRLVYPDSGYRHRCGCSGNYRGRHHGGYSDDGYDYENAYPFSYNDSTRRYTDQHLGGRRGWW